MHLHHDTQPAGTNMLSGIIVTAPPHKMWIRCKSLRNAHDCNLCLNRPAGQTREAVTEIEDVISTHDQTPQQNDRHSQHRLSLYRKGVDPFIHLEREGQEGAV